MSKTSALRIAVLPGDGIGIEVSAAALEVLRVLEARLGGFALAFEEHPLGAACYRRSGSALPETTLRACEQADAMLFGAGGLPDVRYADGTEIAPQLDLRLHFELYAGVRPIRALRGLPGPLSSPRAAEIDFVLVREQTEGLFFARGNSDVRGDSEVRDTMRITRAGTARVADFALRLGTRRKLRGRPGRVTCVDKANVFASMAFFRRVFEERARAFPDLQADCAYVDATALNLVMKPWTFDVMVTENMFGDILSDLTAALVGGMGMAPSGDIGDRHALFQPAHGSAPDIAGQGKANPTAMLLSAAMMLDWLGERHANETLVEAGALLERAIEHAFGAGTLRPFEFGGASGTADITRGVIAALETTA
ncbi:MAG: 3-isopropylmalate dehydrogenase [Betaproteobacteria bacterium SG8_39]|nr:MAG: 3-isopropylmalate dehydrogenase [Betaproteobacteria bacterium SG8_39]